ncbi:MAG: DUF3168 domain-containing protein [Brucella anthropi]
MEEQLTALLLNAAGLTAHVPAANMHWVRAPQGTKPTYLVMQVISGDPDYHMQGPSGYAVHRLQIDIYGLTYTAVKGAKDALVQLLSGHKGGIFQGIFVDSERDLPAMDAGEVSALFRKSIDFVVHHLEN